VARSGASDRCRLGEPWPSVGKCAAGETADARQPAAKRQRHPGLERRQQRAASGAAGRHGLPHRGAVLQLRRRTGQVLCCSALRALLYPPGAPPHPLSHLLRCRTGARAATRESAAASVAAAARAALFCIKVTQQRTRLLRREGGGKGERGLAVIFVAAIGAQCVAVVCLQAAGGWP